MKKPQVNGYSDGLEWAGCKTVGLAYVGSNPTPATQTPRSGPVRVFPVAGPAACPGAVRQTVPGCCGPVVGQIWAGQRLVRAGSPGRSARRLRSTEPISPGIVFAGHSACHRILMVLVGPAVSRWVQLWHGRLTDRIRPGSRRIRGPAVGPLPGRDAECLLDGLAGDLTGAGGHQERQGECRARLKRRTPGIPRPRRGANPAGSHGE
jgi:hypothetical protein